MRLLQPDTEAALSISRRPCGTLLFPKAIPTLSEIGRAMINSGAAGPGKRVLDATDIAAMVAGDRSGGGPAPWNVIAAKYSFH